LISYNFGEKGQTGVCYCDINLWLFLVRITRSHLPRHSIPFDSSEGGVPVRENINWRPSTCCQTSRLG